MKCCFYTFTRINKKDVLLTNFFSDDMGIVNVVPRGELTCLEIVVCMFKVMSFKKKIICTQKYTKENIYN